MPVIDQPEEGYFWFRYGRDRPKVAVRIWFGKPLDPETGEELDRSPRWNCLVNGTPGDVDEVWPRCGGRTLTKEAYLDILGSDDNPRSKVNWSTNKPVF